MEKQRERLIELLKEGTAKAGDHLRETTKKILAEQGHFNSATDYGRHNIYEIEADHLLANGVIVPPCKVGDTVYQTDGVRVYESTVKTVLYVTDGIAFDESAIGSSVFLKREEAALKGGVL